MAGFSSFGGAIPSFSFGGSSSTATTSAFTGFGTTASTGTTAGGGIGMMTTSTAPGLFSGFGSTTTTTTSAPTFTFSGLGSTGSTTTTFPGGGGLGGGGLGTGGLGTGSLFPSSSGFGTNLGTNLGTFGTNSFGQFGTPSFGSNTFGSSSTAGGFGAGLGTGFSTFNQGQMAPGSLQAMQPLTAQGIASQALTNLATSLSCPLVFGDERDVILAKWNKLQAFWGTGKGVFSSSGQFAEFTSDNPFCRFKAIGYSCIPTSKNEDGFIALLINKKISEVITQQQQLVDSVHRILGNRPTLSVCVEGVKPVPDNKTEVIIFILERTPTGASRRIPSSELFAFVMQPNIKMQIIALGIESVVPKSAPNKEQLEHYLNNPPSGIDPLLWQQAKLDNPSPDNLLPVPMIGFRELQLRLKCQEQETKQHQGRLDLIAEDIVELKRCQANSIAKIADLKRKQLDLGHRVLQVMVKQEICRKLGFAIQGDEEQLRVQLEALQVELSAPTQFKGRLNELISQIRMQNHQTLIQTDENYNMDSNMMDDMKQVLKQQQEGISHLVNIIRSDLEDLKFMEQELKENVHHR